VKQIETAWRHRGEKHNLRELLRTDPALFSSNVFGGEDIDENNKNKDVEACKAICLDRGMVKSQLAYSLPEKYFHNKQRTASGSDSSDKKAIDEWLNEDCQRIEFGWINWTPHDATIFWLSDRGERVNVGHLGRKEVNTVWQTTSIGHEFEIVDNETNELIGTSPSSATFTKFANSNQIISFTLHLPLFTTIL